MTRRQQGGGRSNPLQSMVKGSPPSQARVVAPFRAGQSKALTFLAPATTPVGEIYPRSRRLSPAARQAIRRWSKQGQKEIGPRRQPRLCLAFCSASSLLPPR